MRRYWPAIRLSAGLVSLCVSVFFIACALGLVPDRDAAVLAGRKALSEILAVNTSLSAQKDDLESARAALTAAVERNPELISAGLRDSDGKLLIDLGGHAQRWEPLAEGEATETEMQVPIMRGDDHWGTLELSFTPVRGVAFLSRDSLAAFVIFFSASCFGVFYLFLRPLFAGMMNAGPGAVPQRVKTAMNTLAEGVLILDKHERIAMANEAFSKLVGLSPKELQGKKVDDLPFIADEVNVIADGLPWKKAVHGEAQTGVVMGLKGNQAIPQRVSINSTPILGDDGAQRGAMATFDNLTVLERKHAQLRKVLDRLRTSRKVVRRQNSELKALATRDPLTGCFNRRTLFAEFEKMWEASKRFKKPLSCVMVDVDHFKSINDRFGHHVGDEVLKAVAETLRTTARKSDVVCRYGGEEFCILLPHIDLAEAEQAAERFRAALADKPLGDVPVTASLGVSSLSLGPKHPQDMMDQADKALYAAKRSGRNKVMRFDTAPKDLFEGKEERRREVVAPSTNTPVKSIPEVSIPFQAVSGLLAALGYRHAETAEHCRRVADLCVSAAGGLMSQKEAYLMEMAALLHDIGKLGVPDNVLLKPGPLSAEEWKTIRTHEGIGVEIVRAAFTSDELADLVRLQHCWYGGTPTDPSLPKGQKIPLAARLLAIANAYDSMTTDHSYRRAMPQSDAFDELRRCSGTQFDPVVTEHFIKALSDLNPKKGSKIEPMSISKQIALKIGVQIEKLALALDVQDMSSLASMAGQLKSMAEENNIALIADAAGRLEKGATANTNQMDLMELTIELLEMCRQTQRSLLPAIPKKKRPKTLESIDLRAAERERASATVSAAAVEDSKLMKQTPISMTRPPQYIKKPTETPKPRM